MLLFFIKSVFSIFNEFEVNKNATPFPIFAIMLKVHIESFNYSDQEVLKELRFAIDTNQHLAVLGESGSGKSTLLHLIYGLLELPNGKITYAGKQLGGPSEKLVPGHEFMKLLSQEFDIMPFTTVAENIGSYLTSQDMLADAKRIDALLEVVDLVDYKQEYVKNLSGGQKQRVGLAKALANTPEVLLLDEPFSHIDLLRKTKLRRRLFAYLKENNIGCIYATHDSEEALAFSDKILLLGKNGEQELFDSPQQVYNGVKTAYQASFFGEVNDLRPWWPKDEKRWYYPEQLEVSDVRSDIRGIVKKSYFKGSYYLLEVDVEHGILYVQNKKAIPENSTVFIIVR